MIIFAGDDGGYPLLLDAKNDVWVLANANGLGATPTWTHLVQNGAAGSPPARELHTALYDAANNRMIIFGGENATTYFNDVWVLTDANGQSGTPTWAKLFPTGGPPAARGQHNAVYDPGSNTMTIFGGINSTSNLTDVWVLSHANGLGGTPSWKRLSVTGGPPPSNLSAAIYDPVSNVMTVFGGCSTTPSCNITNGVWALSNANGSDGLTSKWTNLVANGAPGAPPKRDAATAVYDPATNRMIVYGGGTFTGNLTAEIFSDVWVLSNANGIGGTPTWTKLSVAAPVPNGRDYTTAVFDALHNRMIVFGGLGWEGVFYSVWVLSGANGI